MAIKIIYLLLITTFKNLDLINLCIFLLDSFLQTDTFCPMQCGLEKDAKNAIAQ
ncbi:MAG: hypothetical protein ACKPEN_21185 [Planktothrix sp.]|uniref:hypothetical protein n=1 Tax=Planktothrix sp. TaxID=3088171 RepID=UPI0038D439CD